MAKTIDTEKIEEIKTLYKQVLDKRDAYIIEDSVYIENKRKKVGLLSSNNLAEFCFSLKFKMEASILIFNDIIDDILISNVLFSLPAHSSSNLIA